MGFIGNWFTWERGNLPETNIQEQLERGVANKEWFHLFPKFQLQHLPHTFSDHCPLLVKSEEENIERTYKSFKFEAWWVLEDSFFSEVKKIWEHSEEDLLSKLDSMKRGLKRWASQIRYNRKERKKMLTSRLAMLLEAERDYENLADLIDTKIQLNFEIDKDECYWEQRARVNWLKFGDKNTAFFHKQATQKRQRNLIR
ncbi:uncharacterized protein LOC108451567 [Gossypium arboreum]|uniref:uncharacterized protein LOC108451567 n=1 Tax=Gossypium arboreum TaxID=29729 RepID=UPI0008196CDA|nr:uncharacterized protein LOC108451567 [Gossypium arboreum]